MRIFFFFFLACAHAHSEHDNCPRFHVGPRCDFAFPSCVVNSSFTTSCDSPATCECLAECEANFYIGKAENTKKCFENGRWKYTFRQRTTTPGTFNTNTIQHGLAGQAADPPTVPDAQLDLAHSLPISTCANNCRGRGRCENGVCLCSKHWRGLDCSTPHAHVHENDDGFIYVYELPPGLNAWRSRNFMDRNSAISLYEYILRSRYRTKNPHQATLFWMPVTVISAVWGQLDDSTILLAYQHVAQNYPFYNASGGRDHVAVFSWDNGACWVARDPLVVNTIKVSHYGLRDKDEAMNCECELCGTGGDLVVPDMMELHYKRQTTMRYLQHDTSHRPTLVFMAGSRSGELRASVLDYFETLKHNSTIRVIDTSKRSGIELAGEMKSSKYCLAPLGSGFGTRGTLAIILGCVPVYYGDYKRPFDNTLDYSTFSLHVDAKKISRTMQIIDNADYSKLKNNLDMIWHKFSWTSVLGQLSDEPLEDDAMSMLLKELTN